MLETIIVIEVAALLIALYLASQSWLCSEYLKKKNNQKI